MGTPITATQTALVSVDDVASSERAHAISSVFTASRCDRLYLVLCGAVEPRRELADVEALKGAMMLIRLLRDRAVSTSVRQPVSEFTEAPPRARSGKGPGRREAVAVCL